MISTLLYIVIYNSELHDSYQGAELLTNTQKAYFENHLANLSYLQLSWTTISEDLVDITQNADIQFQMSY